MKVYLIRRRGRRNPAFYSEETEPTQPVGARPRRNRLARWVRTVKAAVLRAEHRAGPRTTRLLGWLMRRPNPDEPLLHALRDAPAVELIHPDSMSPDRAQRLWYNYLRHRQRQQLGAAAWDLLLVAITAPMLIMPGPGVLAFWFLYRALAYLLAMFGTIRARSGYLPIVFQESPALEIAVAPGDDLEIAHLSDHCGIRGLATYLRRLEKRTASAHEPDPRALEHLSSHR